MKLPEQLHAKSQEREVKNNLDRLYWWDWIEKEKRKLLYAEYGTQLSVVGEKNEFSNKISNKALAVTLAQMEAMRYAQQYHVDFDRKTPFAKWPEEIKADIKNNRILLKPLLEQMESKNWTFDDLALAHVKLIAGGFGFESRYCSFNLGSEVVIIERSVAIGAYLLKQLMEQRKWGNQIDALIVTSAVLPADMSLQIIEFARAIGFLDRELKIELRDVRMACSSSNVALMMAAAKLIVPFDQALRRGDWSARYVETPTEILAGKTAVILGYGMIGRRIAPVCQALGMHVIGVRRRQPEGAEARGVEVRSIDALHELLPRADVLHCVLPGTPHTAGLIGARELALLPAHAIVVNVGRGEVIDEEALFDALRDRRIRAAGIDVWYNYPHTAEERTATPPSRFPFHTLDNLVLSPHRAGWLSAAEDNRLTMLAELLNAAAAGQPMPSKVDKVLGY